MITDVVTYENIPEHVIGYVVECLNKIYDISEGNIDSVIFGYEYKLQEFVKLFRTYKAEIISSKINITFFEEEYCISPYFDVKDDIY